MANILNSNLIYRCERVNKQLYGRAKSLHEGRTDDLNSKIVYPILSKTAVERMFDLSCKLLYEAYTKRDKGLARMWFGRNVDVDEVFRKLKILRDQVANSDVKVRYCGKSGSDYLGAYDNSYDDGRWLGIGVPMMYKRFSESERVMTIVHEMSHIYLGTLDHETNRRDRPNDRPVFELGGFYGCHAYHLANKPNSFYATHTNADAITNAENWGYFVVWHGFKTGDWEAGAHKDREPLLKVKQGPALFKQGRKRALTATELRSLRANGGSSIQKNIVDLLWIQDMEVVGGREQFLREIQEARTKLKHVPPTRVVRRK